MKKRKLKFCLTLIFLFLPGVFIANSQVLVESVAAIVGNEVIYLSDLENTVADLRRNGNKTAGRSADMQCISGNACFKTFYGSGKN